MYVIRPATLLLLESHMQMLNKYRKYIENEKQHFHWNNVNPALAWHPIFCQYQYNVDRTLAERFHSRLGHTEIYCQYWCNVGRTSLGCQAYANYFAGFYDLLEQSTARF